MPRPRSPLQTWWTILRICLEERLVYRGDFALGTLMRFLPIVTQIFLWAAIFIGSSKTTIANYTYHDMIAYYLLTMISRAFSSMPGLASGIAAQIRNGEIKKFLIQPVDLLGFLLLARVAHKLVYYVVAAGPFALVFFLCRGYFPGWPEPIVMLAFLASLVMSFLLGFFLEATMGMIGFWFLEVSSLLVRLHAVHVLSSPATCSRSTCCRPAGRRCCGSFRCNTWPIFRPPSSWERSRGPNWPWG